jgi:hypothetical protein
MKRLLYGIAVGVLLLLLAAVSYYCYDRIVSLDYCRGENVDLRRQQDLLMSLLLRTGRPLNRAQWSEMLKADFSNDHLVKEYPNELSVDNVLLKFKGNDLIEIKSAN